MPTIDQVKILIPNIIDIEEIGQGGFKTVYRARDVEGNQVVKLIGLPLSTVNEDQKKFYEESLKRAQREIQILESCNCSFIVKLGRLKPTIVEIENQQYVLYSEEYLNGLNLWQLIEAKGQKPNELECRVLMQSLLKAIEYLWTQKQIIHRDIKPHNVIKIRDPIRPFVVFDLGIAFSLLDTALTFNPQNRLPPATFRYMAPEMANPHFRSSIDYRSDLYSAALTVYEYAAQMHPLSRTSDNIIQTLSRVVHETPVPLQNYRSDLSLEFCSMINQLLKKKPALRPANIKTLIARMENSL